MEWQQWRCRRGGEGGGGERDEGRRVGGGKGGVDSCYACIRCFGMKIAGGGGGYFFN
jgi:hypothetical protein